MQGARTRLPARHRTRPKSAPSSREVKELESQGYEFEAAEASLALLIRGILEHNPELLFTVEGYHVSMRRDGSLRLRSHRQGPRRRPPGPHRRRGRRAGQRAGQRARAQALAKFFPQLKKVRLTDYKVRILDGGTGTAAKTRVLIESSDGTRDWGTVGVSENIITASLQALVDSIEYALLYK